MPQVIDVPGQGQVEFPDGMTDADIVSAIKKNSMSSPPDPYAYRNTPLYKQQMASIHDWGSGLPNIAYNAGSNVTEKLAKYLPAPVAAGAGYLANVGIQAVPALFGGQVVKEAAAPVMQSMAQGLMQSAVKPTLQDLKSGDAAKAINTMLQEGYNPTEGGVRAMQGKIDALSNQIKEAVANSPEMINKTAVASRLQSALDRFSKQVNPSSDIKAIENAWSEFLSHPLLAGKAQMTVPMAQALKTGTYNALGDKPYGELQGAAIEAQKQLARGLKEEISTAVPQVAQLNAQEAALLNARDIAMRRALMSSNRNPLSLAPLAGGPGGFLGFMADKSDLVKALLARFLYSGRNAIPTAVGATGGALLGNEMGQPPALQPPQGALYR